MPKKNWYAVKYGKQPGIYKSWPECQSQTAGFPGAVFKGFENYDDALNFIARDSTKKKASDTMKRKTEDRPDIPTKKGKLTDNMSRAGIYDDSAVVYTDGACTDNGKKNPKAGCGVYWGLTKWRQGYEKRNFKSSSNPNEPIKNIDMIKYLYALYDNHTASIKIHWVKGHNKHPDNEAADELAVAGAKLPAKLEEVDWESLAILCSSSVDDVL
ncbi:hypothetical protein E3Q23_03527 [Wallemia mellicola]|uniref:Ribonuclease H n=1 Tax=Wallemia mellicola TaxID=1708541 RepID=A0A4T0TDB1_9BASI|nr:hypothetical protein E3Q23_03527 [Wallemia mellicola]TIC50740.1 ribonuclease H-like protein [Wallemia mellicola]TIC63202.1 ribonuclease H-like protein [Wallemia mellicola]